MDLVAKLIKKPIIFRGITVLTPSEFHQATKKLTPLFRKKYIKNKKLPGRPTGIKRIENKLLCLLIYYRTYTTQLFVGFLFQVDAATVCRTIKRLEPLLARVMKIKKEWKMSQKEVHTLIVDCTEQPIRRPKKRQKDFYSGKKKRHTNKTEMIVNGEGEIYHVSRPLPGSIHDIKVREKGIKMSPCQRLLADSGYQGQQKKYPNICLPLKKPRGGKLNRRAKIHNKKLALQRIIIEHRFAQMKVFQILAQIYRNQRNSYRYKTAIIAGLVNMKNGF